MAVWLKHISKVKKAGIDVRELKPEDLDYDLTLWKG